MKSWRSLTGTLVRAQPPPPSPRTRRRWGRIAPRVAHPADAGSSRTATTTDSGAGRRRVRFHGGVPGHGLAREAGRCRIRRCTPLTDPRQRRRDIERLAALESLGWIVIRSAATCSARRQPLSPEFVPLWLGAECANFDAATACRGRKRTLTAGTLAGSRSGTKNGRPRRDRPLSLSRT